MHTCLAPLLAGLSEIWTYMCAMCRRLLPANSRSKSTRINRTGSTHSRYCRGLPQRPFPLSFSSFVDTSFYYLHAYELGEAEAHGQAVVLCWVLLSLNFAKSVTWRDRIELDIARLPRVLSLFERINNHEKFVVAGSDRPTVAFR